MHSINFWQNSAKLYSNLTTNYFPQRQQTSESIELRGSELFVFPQVQLLSTICRLDKPEFELQKISYHIIMSDITCLLKAHGSVATCFTMYSPCVRGLLSISTIFVDWLKFPECFLTQANLARSCFCVIELETCLSYVNSSTTLLISSSIDLLTHQLSMESGKSYSSRLTRSGLSRK